MASRQQDPLAGCLAFILLGALFYSCCGLPDFKGTKSPPTEATPARVASQPTAVSHPAVPHPQESPTHGRRFLESKLAEPDSFKLDPKFHEHGFSTGGPYNARLTSVELKHNDDATKFSLLERVAVGDLLDLGLEYVSRKRAENNSTRFARKEIEGVMRGDGS